MGRGRSALLRGRIGSRRVQARTRGHGARCGFIVTIWYGHGAVGGRIIAIRRRIRLSDRARRVSSCPRPGNRRRAQLYHHRPAGCGTTVRCRRRTRRARNRGPCRDWRSCPEGRRAGATGRSRLQAARAEKAARIDSLRAQIDSWEAEQRSNEADLRRGRMPCGRRKYSTMRIGSMCNISSLKPNPRWPATRLTKLPPKANCMPRMSNSANPVSRLPSMAWWVAAPCMTPRR